MSISICQYHYVDANLPQTELVSMGSWRRKEILVVVSEAVARSPGRISFGKMWIWRHEGQKVLENKQSRKIPGHFPQTELSL